MQVTEAWKSFAREPGEASFRPLYESTKRLVWTLCRRILSNEADAADAFQSAYCRLLVLAKGEGVEAGGDDPVRLVARIAIREADRLRKERARRGRRTSELRNEAVTMSREDPAAEVSRREITERVERIVGDLPDRYRLPVQLHFFHGLSRREVARVLDEPLSTVSDRIQGALRKLDPAFRRAGLGNAAATFAGLAIAGILFEPGLSAAVVFRGAEASAAALSASGLPVSQTITTSTFLGGLAIMKLKAVAFAAVLIALMLTAVFTLQPPAPRPAPGSPVVDIAPDPVKTEPAASVAETVRPKGAAAPGPEVAAVPAAPPEDAITGMVTDAVSREPLPGAVVHLSQREGVTDAAGAYRLESPGAGNHEIIVSAVGHARQLARVEHLPAAVSRQDFALDPAIQVQVTVTDVEGRPISMARVTPPYYGSSGVYNDSTMVQTDLQGIAFLDDVSRLKPPDVMVEKDGFRRSYFQPRSGEGEEVVECKVVLEEIAEKPRAIVGRVIDPAGLPIPGAIVEWKDGQGTSFGDGVVYGQFRATTGFDGAYRLEYDDDYDTCSLGVAAKGWGPVVATGVRPGTPGEPLEKDFTLEPAHWLSGRVIDDAGKPLGGVQIHAMPSRHLLNEAVAYPAVMREALTDEEGRFRLEDLAGPRVALHLRAADARPSLDEEFDVDREVEIDFPGYGQIRGVVVDEETEAAVTSFNIKLSGVSLESGRVSLGETFTANDGRFVLKGLEARARHQLFVQAEGYLTAVVEGVVPAESEEVRIALTKGRPVDGVVVDAATSEPLGGVTVYHGAPESLHQIMAREGKWIDGILMHLQIQKTVSGADGSFHLREGEPAALLVRAAGRQRLLVSAGERPRYAGGGGLLRLPLVRGARLRGVCHDGSQPARRVDVQLERGGPEWGGKSEEERAHGVTTTDGEGRFAWDDLSPGTYDVWVARKAGGPKPPLELRVVRRLEIAPGDDRTVDLAKDPGPHTLRGRIEGMDSRESLGITVTLRPLLDPEGDGFILQSYKSWDWRYTCPYLRPGRYSVEARFWEAGGTRSVELEPLEVSTDAERAIEVPAER